MTTTYKTHYQGPSEYHGSRIRVTNLRTGKHRYHSWDYSVNGGIDQHRHAVRECAVAGGEIVLTGLDKHGYYLTLTTAWEEGE